MRICASQSCLSRHFGITLIEALVTIAILGLMTSLFLGAIQKVRAASSRIACANNMRQLSIAMHSFHDAHQHLPAGTSVAHVVRNTPYMPYAGWQTRILPHIEQSVAWDEAMLAYAANPDFLSPTHRNIRAFRPASFICQTDGRIHSGSGIWQSVGFTSYLGIEGINQFTFDGLLYTDSYSIFRSVQDGLSNTLLLGERPPSSDMVFGWWYAGWGQNKDGSAEMILGAREVATHDTFTNCDIDANRYRLGRLVDQCDGLHFWSLHSGGANFAFADGSVRFLAYSADSILPALATRAGGEVVTLPD